MANGTIAFDTLTTSDQVNTGTEKSIDTSYIYNVVAKVHMRAPADLASISESFNVSSLYDDVTFSLFESYFSESFLNIFRSSNFINIVCKS